MARRTAMMLKPGIHPLGDAPMALMLGLHSCNLSTRFRPGTNPFTGQAVRFPLDDGLTAGQRAAVRQILDDAGANEPDPDTYRGVRCADGGAFNIAVGTINDADARCVAFALEIDPLTADVAAVLFKLARSAN